jgi:hypothetical protein
MNCKQQIKEQVIRLKMSSVNWHTMDDDALKLAAFGEGIPPSSENKQSSVEDTQMIAVYKDCVKTQTPFGMMDTAPFLELFWRKTGADCDGEEEYMVFPDGKTYHITLHDTKK